MKVNAKEMMKTVNETYLPGAEFNVALNKLNDLMWEYGLQDNPKYRRAVEAMHGCVRHLEAMGLERGMEVCRLHATIETISENPIGKCIVNSIKKKD